MPRAHQLSKQQRNTFAHSLQFIFCLVKNATIMNAENMIDTQSKFNAEVNISTNKLILY